MDLRTCENCRIVLNVEGVVSDPGEYDHEEDTWNGGNVAYNLETEKDQVYIRCPVCDNRVFV